MSKRTAEAKNNAAKDRVLERLLFDEAPDQRALGRLLATEAATLFHKWVGDELKRGDPEPMWSATLQYAAMILAIALVSAGSTAAFVNSDAFKKKTGAVFAGLLGEFATSMEATP